jgi:long-chain acyl-CoA synthetase
MSQPTADEPVADEPAATEQAAVREQAGPREQARPSPDSERLRTYADRPWLDLYGEGRPSDITADHEHGLAMWAAAVRSAPDAEIITYFDGVMTTSQVDIAAGALAVALMERGFEAGDRLALYVQNDPAFVIGLVAAWKAGGAAVAVNPMNKARELTYLLADSGASALLCLDDLYVDVARDVVAGGETQVRTVVTCSALDGPDDLADLVARYAGRQPPAPPTRSDDVAVLTYTSGTTGVPKGAMNTHGNIVFNAQTYRDWMGLGPGDRILGLAPLFHITGLIGHVALAMLLPAPLVLSHRFHPGVMLDAVREHRPTFTIGAITAFIALGGAPGATREDFASLRAVYSGGAPIAPAVADRFERDYGVYIHNIYGLTESNSPTHAVPFGHRAPVDPSSGALSIGVPVFSTAVRVLDDDGAELPVGEVGEVAISGPQIVPGYWGKPEATAAGLPGGELRTGDVGFMDEAGWWYLVDRKKDLINASGYKVWPREVEDVLYEHPAVHEAAVIGIPDDYRGETVQAWVSLEPGAVATPGELIEHCRAQLAAYKYPRSVIIVDELPKTVTGKILRRELRSRST